jgi:hypothetical protein
MQTHAEQSVVGSNELRGLAALQHAMRTGCPLMRRHTFGLRTEPISHRCGYALWSCGAENQLYVEVSDA